MRHQSVFPLSCADQNALAMVSSMNLLTRHPSPRNLFPAHRNLDCHTSSGMRSYQLIPEPLSYTLFRANFRSAIDL